MKKIVSLVLSALLLCTLVLSLASCSTYNSIEKRFVNAGYEVVDTTDEDGNDFLDFAHELEEGGEVSCTVHILKKDLVSAAIILEFGADKDAAARLDELLTEDDYNNFIEADEKSDYLNGNCVLVPFSLNIFDLEDTIDEMKDIFSGDD
ncbi:MAG: hypothetical protein IJ012_05245 [Clostridia bacterium]|nr:hypothetical protein [Clostridia bacterium]